MHLDKVYTLPMLDDRGLAAYTSGTMGEAMTSIELPRRSSGTTTGPGSFRTFAARSTPRCATGRCTSRPSWTSTRPAGLEGMAAVLAAREEYRRVLDLQVVAFPQDGLLRDPGAAELCEEALAMGADVVGGIPWIEDTDADARAPCRVGLLRWPPATGRGSRCSSTTPVTPGCGPPRCWPRRCCATTWSAEASPVTPGPWARTDRRRCFGWSSSPGRPDLGFVSDPHTGPLHLPVREFLAPGLPVALGQDDIEDAYYPFGRATCSRSPSWPPTCWAS